MTHPLFARFHHLNKKGKAPEENFSSGWQSPSNIALVKYWGKKDGQLPLNPSLSMTLKSAVTQTRVHASTDEDIKGLISVNSDEHHAFLPKMQQLLKLLTMEMPFLGTLSLRAETLNSFPHSTGIASSASGMSAFALCLLDIACYMLHEEISFAEWQQMASCASRLGSGSACRSVYGGYAMWGKSILMLGSSDDFAIPVNAYVHPDMMSLRDAILIVSTKPKKVPSSQGHQSMKVHPYLTGRITQANQNLADVLHALASDDFEQLAAVAENEALSLHGLLMSASPGTILIQPGTLQIIHHVREARKKGLPLLFTLDAGANVHILYPAVAAKEVEEFIHDILCPFCEDGTVIYDECGSGPVRLSENQEKSAG